MNKQIPKLRFPEFTDEWEKKKLVEIIELMQSGVSRMLSDPDIGLPVIRSNNIKNNILDVSDIKYWYKIDNQGVNLENYYLKEGDLLVNFINSLAQIGKVALYKNYLKRHTIFTTNLMRISFKNSIDTRFIFNRFLMKDYRDYIQSITKPAVNQASFTSKEFQSYKLLIPLLPEQTKIADFLTAIDEKINYLTKKKDLIEKYKKCLMQKIFSQEIRFKDDDGNDYPDWEDKKLGDILIIIDGDRGTNYPNGNDFSDDGYCIFLNAKNVTRKGFSFEEKSFITKEKDEQLRKGKLKRYDLILTTRGSVGNIAYYNDEITFKHLRINSGMVIIRNEDLKIDSNYVYKLFSSFIIQNQIYNMAFGSAQPQLTVKELNKLLIIIPSFKEQTKIAEFLTSIDEKIDLVNLQLEKVKSWKQGLLQQMFI